MIGEWAVLSSIALAFVDHQRNASEAQMEIGRPAAGDSSGLHQVKAKRIRERQVLIRKLVENCHGTARLIRPKRRNVKGLIASVIERNCSARVRSYRRRNQPWPSAMKSGVVISLGGAAKSRRKSE